MHQLERLLIHREAYRARLDREIEALRISLQLLEEDAAATAVASASERGVTVAQVVAFPNAPGANGQVAKTAANAASAMPEVATASAAIPTLVFPQAQNGAIVCDACGYKNPLYVTDCERCDIPIRPRE